MADPGHVTHIEEAIMIVVIAMGKARAGSEEAALAALAALAVDTRKEAGCIQYDVHVALEDAAQLAVYERWTDKTALDAHFAEPHTQRFFAHAGELLAGPPSIVSYSLVE
jgi:quinol monooxygenase YgiN